MKPAILVSLAAVCFCGTAAWAEPAMNKCTDGRQLTYTDKPCKKLGLKEAGPIKDTLTIVPAAAPEAGLPGKDAPKDKRDKPVPDGGKAISEDPFSGR